MLDRLRALVDCGPQTVRECRQCGTTLDDEASECPACGSTAVATYEL